MLRDMLLTATAVLAISSLAMAQDEPTTQEVQKLRETLKSLKYQTGEIALRGGMAKLKLSKAYRFLDGNDAEKVLVDLWDNLPGKVNPLGMILPADVSPASADCWCVVIYWSEEGYVKDDEAEKIDYDDMLKQMKQTQKEANAERAARKLPSLDLVGWAQPPRYDRASHKLYWATELASSDCPEHTLNYRIRVLGRRGVLDLNAIAGMKHLDMVTKATPELLNMVDFNQGNRYVDFNPSTDKVAEYGLAALIAGGVAAKVGFFKGIWIAALAAKKFIIIGLVALGAFLKKIWGRIFGRKNQ